MYYITCAYTIHNYSPDLPCIVSLLNMRKKFKLKLSLQTFGFWRTKVSPSLPKTYLKSTTLYSPINSKSLDISYPSFSDPPPTPIKIMHVSFNTEHYCPSPSQKIYNSPVAITPPPLCQKTNKQRKDKTRKSKASSISSGDSSWVSSDENKSLISTSENIDSSCDFGNIIPIVSSATKNGDESPTKKSSSVCSPLMTSCAVNDESFMVVKNSQNPHEDFKNSMMEIIMEKKMFKVEDLEELLQCFLSLNSRHHHGVIIQAFSEIWHLMFF